eukprot:scaffold76671_cov42-Prasinocladus_malaysianus.AAC.1
MVTLGQTEWRVWQSRLSCNGSRGLGASDTRQGARDADRPAFRTSTSAIDYTPTVSSTLHTTLACLVAWRWACALVMKF